MDQGFDRDTLVLLTRGMEVEIHRHYAVQLVVSLDRPYPAELDGQTFASIPGFLANAQVPHACRSGGSKLLIISVDAASRKGLLLQQTVLRGKSFCLLPELAPAAAIRRFIAECNNVTDNMDFDYLRLLRQMIPPLTREQPLDARVARALTLLRHGSGNLPRLAELSAAVGLSASRFSHLFRDELGISVTSFVLWTRMRKALGLMARPNTTLTAAAHEAGFADHPHFTRTFIRMFGIPPSVLQERAEFLRVFS